MNLLNYVSEHWWIKKPPTNQNTAGKVEQNHQHYMPWWNKTTNKVKNTADMVDQNHQHCVHVYTMVEQNHL